jgi:tRNA 2-thiouridine synthesizing protein A
MPQPPPEPPLVFDSGDLACGELLIELHLLLPKLADGQILLLLSNDPAAPLDLRAWCALRGQTYLGETRHEGRPAYLIRKELPKGNHEHEQAGC